MKVITKIIFTIGDVLLPRIYLLTIRMLEKNGVVLTDKERIGIHDLEKALLNGALSESEYMLRLTALSSAQIPLNENSLLESVYLDNGVLSLVKDLSKNKDVFLFSDYPKNWLAKIDKNGSISNHFKRVIYSQDISCNKSFDDIFIHLMAIHEIQAGNSMWVDSDPFRTSIAIRHGIDAIIYVDERRLRRELNLRKLLTVCIKSDNQ